MARSARLALLGPLARAMAFQGAYALKPDGALIRVAFDRGNEALLFAREGGWAGQWAFLFDAEAGAGRAHGLDRGLCRIS